jgi:uncharacterized membrane protein
LTDTTTTRPVDPSLVSYTHWMYALHALAAVIGISTPALVATAFVFGWPSIIAVIMNYVKRDQVRGTWLDSHFSWQLRTFWWAAMWILVISVISFIFAFVLIGFIMWPIGIALVGLWILYRVVRGWLALKDGRAV